MHYILSTAVTRADLVQLLRKAGALANLPDSRFVARESPSRGSPVHAALPCGASRRAPPGLTVTGI